MRLPGQRGSLVQEEFDVSAMVGCGHVFGLFLQPLWPLAMM
jgi:hypothetical protein